MARRERLILAMMIGLMAGGFCYVYQRYIYVNPADFLWPLEGARALLAGQNPYEDATRYPLGLPLYYPLPTLMAVLPFIAFPEHVGSALFFGLSSALVAYFMLQSQPPWRLLLFLSAPYYEALRTVQWSPLLTLMTLLPALLPLALIKPNLGLSLALADPRQWTRRSLMISAILLLLSFVLSPTWPVGWLFQLGPYGGVPPLLVEPLGFLLVFALLRWRDYEGRLLFFMALLPKRVFYDQLALWMIPRNAVEMALLTVASWVGYIAWFASQDWENRSAWMVGALYLPALAVLLYPLVFDWIKKRVDIINARE
ncbi:MAG: hypothetical protein H0T73_02780 [Ardenticatenales bacterium]|nr:hypothetical protein [Ardenticatenales bacterium]